MDRGGPQSAAPPDGPVRRYRPAHPRAHLPDRRAAARAGGRASDRGLWPAAGSSRDLLAPGERRAAAVGSAPVLRVRVDGDLLGRRPVARAVGRRQARRDSGQDRCPGRHPMTVGMVKVRTALVEFLTVAGVAIVLLALGGLVRLLLNRRRMAYWGIEWACFGPRWSTRRWPRS